MSEIPKKVQEAIRKAAHYHEIARKHQAVIEAWLEKIGKQEDDSFRDVLIDTVEQTNNPDDAIEMFEIML